MTLLKGEPVCSLMPSLTLRLQGTNDVGALQSSTIPIAVLCRMLTRGKGSVILQRGLRIFKDNQLGALIGY